MSQTNQELVAMFEQYADKLNILKAEGGALTLDTTNFGNVLPRQAVDELINLSRAQNEWLAALNTRRKAQKSGTVMVLDLNEPVSEGVGENDDTLVTTRPPTTNVPYVCKGFRSQWVVTMDDIREAVAAGVANFETEMQAAFAKAIGNDKANAIYNGDTSLDNSTRLNRLLRQIDGISKKLEGANVVDGAGTGFGRSVFGAMLDNLPDRFANDPNLRWLFNRRVNSRYDEELGSRVTALGDQKLISAILSPPLGIPQLIVPHISSTLHSTPIAPTSAADNTTYITFVLTTLVTAGDPATAALGAGRKFKVTLKSTGISEICTGFVATTLQINTVGLLGQSTVSTTASDYEVSVYDETEVVLGNPAGITVVECYDVRAYREFIPKLERFEITTHWNMDLCIPNLEAYVKVKRMSIPAKSTWTAGS